jgi:hypothetical protein
MPLLRWIAHVFRATFWLAVNLVVVAGLFLLSAHLGRQDDDARNGLYFFRVVASVWLFAALWSYVGRGILRRPAPVADKKKITKAEAAKGSFGCVGRLILIAIGYVVLGNYAEWAYDGLIGTDPQHPVRQWVDRLSALSVQVTAQPEVYAPYIVGGLLGFVLLYAVASFLASPRPMRAQEARRAVEATKLPGASSRKQRRPDVAAANEAALAAARRHGAAAAARSAEAVGAAHAGAHRTDPAPPHPDHLFGKAERASAGQRRGAREDAVVGALTWSPSDSAWWARRGKDDAFAVRIDADEDGPSPAQLDLARSVVQRSFEALLRGSDAARPAALAKGVGLPRFTIATARVGQDAGTDTPVTLHLRCDGDSNTDYVVRSTDHLHTFKAG